MIDMLNFTEEEKNEIRYIIHDYHQMNMVYSNYVKELERIKNFLEKVEDDFNIIKSKEKELMDRLHEKYGDFSLQQVYEMLSDGTEPSIR